MNCFFAIVCEGRSGSNLLVDLLQSHPDIECAGELYHPVVGTFKDHQALTDRQFLDHQVYRTAKPIRGFKMPINWILERPDTIREFRIDQYKIIRLDRENLFDQFLSLKLATLNANWCSDTTYDLQRIRVDPWEWLEFAGVRRGVIWVMDTLCQPFARFRITYEQLLTEHAQTALLQFLGAAPMPLQTRKIRMRTKPVDEIVENYDELAQMFKNSPHAAYFPPRDQALRRPNRFEMPST
jgi:hypothetical protein